MKVLFLTIGRMSNIEDHSIYQDLLRCFRDHEHDVYTVSTREKRLGLPTEFCEENGTHALRVRIGNITQCSLIEKGISTVLIGRQYKAAIQKYLSNIKFDLILYSTPPITLVSVVKHIKKRDNAKTYLLLKDIFPQNAVDLGMMSKHGIKAPIYWYFRRKEKKLYALSNRIGCMSRANVDYVLCHNPELDPSVIDVCPNCIDVQNILIDADTRNRIRRKYDIPLDKKVLIYGGNFGKPQGIPFMIECLRLCRDENVFFLMVGNGTEFGKLEKFVNSEKPQNVRLMESLPKEDYDRMVAACDVGMIFLDHRFTIPNFPSRLLPYMQAELPVLACTDPNTDVGQVVVDGGFGWKCESNSAEEFRNLIQKISIKEDFSPMRRNAKEYLLEHFSVQTAYDTVVGAFALKAGKTVNV